MQATDDSQAKDFMSILNSFNGFFQTSYMNIDRVLYEYKVSKVNNLITISIKKSENSVGLDINEKVKNFKDYLHETLMNDYNLYTTKSWHKYADGLGVVVLGASLYGVLDKVGKPLLIKQVGCGNYFCTGADIVPADEKNSLTRYYEGSMVPQLIKININNTNKNLRVMQDFAQSCGDLWEQIHSGSDLSNQHEETEPKKPRNIFARKDGVDYLISDVNNALCPTGNMTADNFTE